MLLVDEGTEQIIAAEAILRLQARKAERARPPLPLLEWLAKARPTVHGLPYGRDGLPVSLRDIYADTHREIVVVKAAQVGVSEWLVSLALWCADTRQGGRGNSLYVFPAISQVYDFVRARVDSAIEESPYLDGRVHPRRGLVPVGKLSDNMGLKKVGDGFVYFRGSNAEAGLLTIDADLVVYDEVDRLREGTLDKGSKRLGSSTLGWQRFVGTPTYPEQGIDALWQRSDRRRWHLRCEHCGERQPLEFPTNVREDGEVICRACHGNLDRLAVGEWVAEVPGADTHGYHVTKLLSPRADINALAKLGHAILRGEVPDDLAVQEFYNQDLGLAHVPEGGFSVVPFSMALAAESREAKWEGVEVVACDVARAGRNRTVIYSRRGRAARCVWRVQGQDTMQTAGVLAEYHRSHPRAQIVVDGVGVGGGVIDRLREQGIGVYEFLGGAAASEPARFANITAECWWRMREAYEQDLAVEPDERLRSQVSGRQYKILSDRRIALEDKETMAAQGRESPDDGDALAMTFALAWDVRNHAGPASNLTPRDGDGYRDETGMDAAQRARQQVQVIRGHSGFGGHGSGRFGALGKGHERG